MLILFNLTDSTVQTVPSSAQLQSTPNEAMLVRLVRTTAAATTVEQLIDGGTLELLVLPKGQREGDNLIILGSVTRNTEAGAYQLPINALTDKVVELLKICDGDPATDVASVLVEAWLRYTPATGSAVTSQAIPMTLVSAPNFEGAAPTAIPSADSMYLRYDAGGQTLSSDDKTRVQTRIGLGTAATHAHSDYATAAQGAKADTAVQPADLTSGLAGKADLVAGKVPSSQLPSYVDDVVEAANYAALPGTGETGKLYITLSDNKVFRWSGSAYVEITSGLDIASQAEAEAGTNNTKAMTPLRTAEAIAALGGGGSSLIYGVAQLLGYTDPGGPATSPPDLTLEVVDTSGGGLTLTIGTYTRRLYIGDFDPVDGSTYVNTATIASYGDKAQAIFDWVQNFTGVGSDYFVSISGNIVTVTAAASGAGAILGLGENSMSLVTAGGGDGTDETAPSGQVSLIDIIGATAGKAIRIVNIGYCSTAGMTVPFQIGFLNGITFNPVATFVAIEAGGYGIISPQADLINNWFGSFAGYSLHMMFNDEIPVGGDVKVWAVVEEV